MEEPRHVIDREGLVWRVVRDGMMATRADFNGIQSIGIETLKLTRGPITELEPLLNASNLAAVLKRYQLLSGGDHYMPNLAASGDRLMTAEEWAVEIITELRSPRGL